MPHTQAFTALGKKYEILMEPEKWFEVRLGNEIVWPRSQWPLDQATQIPITENKLIQTQASKYLRIETERKR